MTEQKGIVFTNLNWTDIVKKRLQPERYDYPGWFGHGITMAGYSLYCSSRPTWKLIEALFKRRKISILCFNPSFFFLFLFLLPLKVQRLSLFQWTPLGRVGPLKRIAVWALLKRSHKVVVYSETSRRYLRRFLKDKSITQIGLYVDTEYFAPVERSRASKKDFILVPGNHRRDETFLSKIAEAVDMDIVRVTSDPIVAAQVQAMSPQRVRLAFNVPFSQLRDLYRSCATVLILSDSSEIPTGITTLSEALACGANVVISAGHSCSWPKEVAANFPFRVIPKDYDVESVTSAVLCARNANLCELEKKRNAARKFATQRLSADILSQHWARIIH